jgi:hypothetical protein
MRPPVIQVDDTSVTAVRDDRERICPIPPVVRRSSSPIQNPDRAEIAAGQQREVRKHDIHVADTFKYFGIAPVCHCADASAVDAVAPMDIDGDRSISYRPARLVMNSYSHAAHRAKHCRRLAVLIEEFNSCFNRGNPEWFRSASHTWTSSCCRARVLGGRSQGRAQGPPGAVEASVAARGSGSTPTAVKDRARALSYHDRRSTVAPAVGRQPGREWAWGVRRKASSKHALNSSAVTLRCSRI